MTDQTQGNNPSFSSSNNPTASSSSSSQNVVKVLLLPKLQIPGVDSRFTFLLPNPSQPDDKKLVFIEMPEKIKALEDKIAQVWQMAPTREGIGIYLHGIQGIGKSHLLYYEVWKLRQSPEYRVCYIPDLGEIAWEPVNIFLEALAEAFRGHENPKDEENSDIIPTITPKTPSVWDPKTHIQILKLLDIYCKNKNLKLVIVLDQINAVSKAMEGNPQSKPFFSSIPKFPSFVKNSGIVIVSGSANNEFYGYEYTNSHSQYELLDLNGKVHDITIGEIKEKSLGFTDAEFEAWVKFYGFFLGDPELVEAKRLTNLIPLELSILLKMKNENLNLSSTDLLNEYSTRRVREFSKEQRKLFEEKLSNTARPPFLKIVRHMYFSMEVGQQDEIEVYDRKFMFLASPSSNFFYASTPLAFDALMQVNRNAFSEKEMIDLVQKLIKNELSPDAIGRGFENFANWFWAINKIIKFEAKVVSISKSKSGGKAKPDLRFNEFRNFNLIFFKGSAIPDTLSKAKNTLYVPEVSNYASIDYIYYSDEGHLYFFQLTVTPHVKNHMKVDHFVAFGDPQKYTASGVLASYGQKNIIESWRDHLGMDKKTPTIRSIADCLANDVYIVYIGYGVDDEFDASMEGFWVADITKFDPISRVACLYKPK